MIETALEEEPTGHLGYEKHNPVGQGADSGNVRNGTRSKTVLTGSSGAVGIDVPRDRAGRRRAGRRGVSRRRSCGW